MSATKPIHLKSTKIPRNSRGKNSRLHWYQTIEWIDADSVKQRRTIIHHKPQPQ